MKSIILTLFLFLTCGLYSAAFGQSTWKTHFENEKVKIEYRIADCNDRANDMNFSYYLLRFVNKTKKQLNVQFETRAVNKELHQKLKVEEYISFILNPSEIKEGKCNVVDKDLRQLFKDNKAVGSKSKDNELVILNIKTYEL